MSSEKILDYLDGEEKESLVTELESYLKTLVQTSTGHKNLAMQKLQCAVNKARGNGIPSLEVNSAAPTPGLTTEANSPRTSSSPSTNDSAVDESAEESNHVKPLVSDDTTPQAEAGQVGQ